jgi:hypothetical protein
MRVNQRLNLVIPVYDETGTPLYVHATPLPQEVFERYFLVLSKTFAAIYQHGLNVISGPSIASYMLREVAKGLGQEADVEKGLMNEIRRVANVLVLTDDGWRNLLFTDACKQGFLTEDDVREVEGSIVFFILVCAIHKRAHQEPILQSLNELWETQVTSLGCTEYRNSLPISNGTEITEQNMKQSLVPS